MKQNHKNTLIALASIAASALITSCGDQPASAPKAPGAEGASPPAASAPATPGAAAAAPAGDMETIKPEFPKPAFQGTPVPPGNVPNLETPGAPKTEFQAPKGTTLISVGKVVTSSDSAPIIPGPDGLKLITDGDADSADGCFVELMQGPQWVQLDLGAEQTVQQLIVWHFHKQAVIVKGVVAQISNDADFKTGVTTVYNADVDNGCGQGAGTDRGRAHPRQPIFRCTIICASD